MIAVLYVITLAVDDAATKALQTVATVLRVPDPIVMMALIAWVVWFVAGLGFQRSWQDAESDIERAAIALARPVTYAVLLVGFMAAGLAGWRWGVEDRQVLAPAFQVEIMSLVVGEPMEDGAPAGFPESGLIVLMRVSVANLGVASGIANWRVEAQLPTGGDPYRLQCPTLTPSSQMQFSGESPTGETARGMSVDGASLLGNFGGRINRYDRVVANILCVRGDLPFALVERGELTVTVADWTGAEVASSPSSLTPAPRP